MGGCDKHAHRYAHAGERGRRANTAHIDTTGYAFMHDHTCTHPQVTHIGGAVSKDKDKQTQTQQQGQRVSIS